MCVCERVCESVCACACLCVNARNRSSIDQRTFFLLCKLHDLRPVEIIRVGVCVAVTLRPTEPSRAYLSVGEIGDDKSGS